MHIITQQQLHEMLAPTPPDERPDVWTDALNTAMRACAIDTAVRQAAFLAQVLLESGELCHVQEVLNYSAARLRQVWPLRFPTDAEASPFVHNPEKLANKVYANRMGNGDEASGDGWRFRGRGLIQLTGRANYASFASATGTDALHQPDLLLKPAGAALSAAWFWQFKGLNEIADQSLGKEGDACFVKITMRINGATTGLPQRRANWMRARRVLGLGLA